MTPKKKGRPKIDNPMKIRFSVRLDDETYSRLNEFCMKHNILKADAVRQGLEMLMNSEDYK
ncbi:CopG family transcriptional regulator [uncultured Anaerofustis sp.]|uniref:CopG family transcriptional regulator n=1 Tax=uncultured Anaerofustis sp. TaxID=904996 RepID=UPI0025E2E91F|nr:CopG family transcriptional regulator [uncultured Anaerofustis sp.]